MADALASRLVEFSVEFAVEFALNYLQSFALRKLGFTRGTKKEVKKLESALSTNLAILIDAEDEKVKDRHLSDWLVKLKEAIYDAEDVLDEFHYKALLSQVFKGMGIRGSASKLYFSNPFESFFEMHPRIKKVRERLDYLGDMKSEFNLQGPHHVMQRSRVTPCPYVHISCVIGRENDIEHILNHLLMNEGGENISVIPIIGMGGVGKSTLVKSVFNNERVAEYFQTRKWVCVSEDFEITRLVKDLIKSTPNENLSDFTTDMLRIRLRESLNGRRFLLVLDDVWNTDWNKWNELRELLSVEGVVGKIVTTTRSSLAASVMGTISAHELTILSNDESMSFFVKLAFDKGEEKNHPNLMEIGYEIVKKCRGLPLAVRVLGSLLYMTHDVRDWMSIRDNEIWGLEEGIVPALRLSYEQLPSYLKHCFACCSLFPKYYEYSSVELIQLWLAQGLIRPVENQSMEATAKEYVEELISRSFFENVEVHDSYTCFTMHDVLHDLAMFVGQSEFFTIDFFTHNVSKTVRHVSFCDIDLSWEDFPTSLLNQNKLRTVILPVSGENSIHDSFIETCISSFKYMRVLNMSRSKLKVLPSSIGNLKHLRSLTLSGNVNITKLPNSICKLVFLLTLILSGCPNLDALPEDVGGLINLRFLSIIECESLKSLPSSLKDLTTLRELKINGCSELITRCQPETGSDWNIIAHVPTITLEDQKIEHDSTQQTRSILPGEIFRNFCLRLLR